MNDMDLMPEQENAGLAVATVQAPSNTLLATMKDGTQIHKDLCSPQQCRVMEVNEALAPAYAKASTLELTDAEVEQLMAPFPPEAVDIRPHDGLIYISHIHISNRLNRVFKPGKWALVRRREWMEGGTMYGEYVLLIRGCYVGESIGGHPYQPNNPKTNYSDTLESTAAEALRRIAGKRLSCGSQVWESGYAQKWVAENAAQVNGKWIKRMGQPSNVTPLPKPQPKPAHAPAPAPSPAPAKDESPADRKARFIAACKTAGGGSLDFANELFRELGTLMPNEDMTDLPEDKVPATRKVAQNLLDEIKARAGVADDIPMGDAPKPAIEVPRDDDAGEVGDWWRDVEIHFGKNKGTKLGELEKSYLFGWWANWQPKEYKGKISDADAHFRKALDAAGEHYEFKAPEEDGRH